MNRIIIIAAAACLLATFVSAEEHRTKLLGTSLTVTLPEPCTTDPHTEIWCKRQDGVYLTFHFHVEPGKSAHERNFLTQSNLERIANSGDAQRYKRAFERDRARVEMNDTLLRGGVVDPTPMIELSPVGDNVWAFMGIWGATTRENVPLVIEKLEIWDAGERVILDFAVLKTDDDVQTLVNVNKSLWLFKGAG